MPWKSIIGGVQGDGPLTSWRLAPRERRPPSGRARSAMGASSGGGSNDKAPCGSTSLRPPSGYGRAQRKSDSTNKPGATGTGVKSGAWAR
jgi:hypothetical protein